MSKVNGQWRKAAGCQNSGCVEVIIGAGGVEVRDSKIESSPVLSYTTEEWATFIGGVKNGEFDV